MSISQVDKIIQIEKNLFFLWSTVWIIPARLYLGVLLTMDSLASVCF